VAALCNAFFAQELDRMPFVLALIGFLALQSAPDRASGNWPHWRGPSHDGVSRETDLPVSWGARCADAPAAGTPAASPAPAPEPAPAPPQGRGGRRGGGGGREGRPIVSVSCDKIETTNVAWKLAMPAYSGSTPIIWGNTIFLNVATGANTGALELWAVDRTTRAVSWKRPIVDANRMERKQNMSSPSPVTDGQHVWVMTGLGVLKGFDFAGKEIWARNLQTDYGTFGLNWGYASSPLLRGDALYVQVLHGMKTDDPSYLLKIDKRTGKPLWRVERLTDAVSESPDAYTTPLWVEANGRAEVVITGGDVVSGHDPETGREQWRADVLNPQRSQNYRIIASPTFVGGLIIAPTRNNPLVAIRPGGSGNVAESHVAWTFAQGPDVPTPVSDGKLLYIVRDGGVVFALDVKTGATVYGPERLPPGTYSSSPILADGKIYVTTEEEGLTTVFRSGPKFEILSSNTLLGDCSPYCLSTVAVSDGQLFFRTSSYLWAVGDRKPVAATR
jgi:outer membrane protein assembly factor BamB